MHGHRHLSGPGKTAPRLLNDLLDYDLRYPLRPRRHLLADPAPLYKGKPIWRKDTLACHHALMRKGLQTDVPLSKDYKFDGTEQFVIATYCSVCWHHFTVAVDYDHAVKLCKLSDGSNPLHHLICIGSENAAEYKARSLRDNASDKYNQVAECHRFLCSAEQCALRLEITISPPRLSSQLLAPILDVPKVVARGQKEIQLQPERYAGYSPMRPLQALGFLRTYINDAKSGSEATPVNLKKIATKNKKFMLAFGDDCGALFRFLGFESVREDPSEVDGEPAYFWKLPFIDSSNQHFYEDVLIEIEILMHVRPPDEQQSGQVIVSLTPIPALKDIELVLGCFDYPSRTRVVDLSQEEHPYYASLGATSQFTDEFLSWAYDRQCDCDPRNKPYYLDCLEDLAKGRQSDELETKVVLATSAGEYGLKAIEGAYRFFGFDPETKEGDDHILGVYKSRIESAPRQKEEARNSLLIIAKSRDSAKIEGVANDRKMTLAEALEFLNVAADTDSDSIGAAAVALAVDVDKAKVGQALRVIANHRNEYSLQKAASSMESDSNDFEVDVNEAYNRLQITNRNASDDMVFTYYSSLSSGAAAGSKESFSQALRAIAYDRQSNFLLRKLENPDADVRAEPGSADQPVGLDNIGNTCYLNSLLQYFYTITAVRDVVMNIDKYQMDLSRDDVRDRRIGGRVVSKAEVTKGLKFVNEMRDLFENLRTAATRSIKPTKELAELSFFNEQIEETIRRASIASPRTLPSSLSVMNGPVFGPEGPPPPMPTRPSPATINEDVEMVDSPIEKDVENGSESSEATLVDLDPLPAYIEIKEKDNHPSVAKVLSQEPDTVMVNGDGGISEGNKPLSPSRTPPPVPPRNKSGLVIQTNEIPDDTRWKIGTQQDVDEVIRNTTFRMMCAIKPTAIDSQTGDQMDRIRDTFYGNTARYLCKPTEVDRRLESWSSLLVYAVKSKSIDIYEALDTIFDMQQVEFGANLVPQYYSINKLPPVLQIQINRTNYDFKSSTTYKIKNEVKFPETIYLDRYMDSEQSDSALMQRRKQGWEWKTELRKLEARLTALQNSASGSDLEPKFPALRNGTKPNDADINVVDALLSTKDFLGQLQEDEIDGLDIDPTLPDLLEERISEVGVELEEISTRITNLKQNIAEQFTDMRQHEYKIQAVFIHRGEAGSGHYWIYIYDFKNDIWREYNDEYVTVVKDRKKIFEHQDGVNGTPYYLVYVRSTDRDELVDPVCRDGPVQAEEMPTMAWNGDEAIEMNDMEEVRHIEHVTPRPIRPKTVQISEPWDDYQDKAPNGNGPTW